MVATPHRAVPSTIDEIYRRDSRRVFATLIRLLGSFDLAEEALHEAFRAAVEQWPQSGVPENPVAWLVSAGRFKAIDQIRRDARFDSVNASEESERHFENVAHEGVAWDEQTQIVDDRLRLIFTCCHPALAVDAQIALTLREVCGLTTEQIARAYLTTAPTIAQRIVRAKAKIRDAKIPYEVPEGNALRERLESVLRVVYLVYNKGYLPTTGLIAQRNGLISESIYLVRLLNELIQSPNIVRLLALMLLQESRATTRIDEQGDLVLLEDQDRSRWDRAMIDEGVRLAETALSMPGFGSYAIQAAIAAVHAEAPCYEDTDSPPGMPYEGIKGIMLTLTYPTVSEATSVFNALAESGKITMPLSPTFWAKTFGMVTDRFGVSWGINGEEIPV
ncbi:MAG: DUF6596 domain-containing protein [Casimicrobium sp.]